MEPKFYYRCESCFNVGWFKLNMLPRGMKVVCQRCGAELVRITKAGEIKGTLITEQEYHVSIKELKKKRKEVEEIERIWKL